MHDNTPNNNNNEYFYSPKSINDNIQGTSPMKQGETNRGLKKLKPQGKGKNIVHKFYKGGCVFENYSTCNLVPDFRVSTQRSFGDCLSA